MQNTYDIPRRLIRWSREGGFACALLLAAAGAEAQEEREPAPGRIVGHILTDQGAPLSGAVIEIVNGAGSVRVASGADGRYTLTGVHPGVATIRVRAIGFTPKVITGIEVPTGGVVGQDITMVAQALELEEITVFAGEESGSVAAALEEQQYAGNIINELSEEQIRRSPDSDAAQAMQRVSGVTIQDEKYVQVRGLGERYTTTSLNGSRMPSIDPEKKLVPLDLYPAAMLQGVTTSKTFTPEQPGDFAGASVNLKTREFPLGRKFIIATQLGFNNNVTGLDLARAPNAGNEWRALAGAPRALPADLAAAGNLAGSSPEQVNGYIASFRDAWSTRPSTGVGEGKIVASLGGEDPVFGQLLGYLISGQYKADQDVRSDEVRALATANGPINDYRGSSSVNSVQWGGIANLSTRVGGGSTFRWDNTYNRAGDNTATVLAGVNEEFSGQGPLQLTRLSYVQRSVWASTLSGQHLIGDRHLLDWRGGLAGTRRYEPDRSDVIYQADTTGGAVSPVAWADIRQSATRTFTDLNEKVADVGANFRYTTGNPNRPTSIKVGAAYRDTDRDAPATAYDIRNLNLTAAERQEAPETLFGDSNAMAGRFTLLANALAGSYTAKETIGSGYAQMELPLGENIQFVGGARVENWDLFVRSSDVFGADTSSNPVATDVLPALALNMQLSRSQNLRLSATQTVSRPEYREVAAVSSVEILGDRQIVGNPDLQRALIQNYDVRWEWFPRTGEVISLGVFAKRFDQPIEQVLIATTGTPALSFVNAESAFNYGIEVEFRKSLDFISRGFRNWGVMLNATLMQSEIKLGTDSLSSLTNPNRPMTGQAPYVLNTGLLYSNDDGRWSSSLLFNVVGRRIVEAGQQPLPDAYEESRPILDFYLRGPLTTTSNFRIDLKNIMDTPFEITQGDVTRVRYTTGREFRIGFQWDL